ncbi:hypothetical protein [Terriglobus roseus]|uniref:hypothetical protein n=1 Tax=Terriglobus roseus TaxID=392734 RepID=UPI001E64741D|nr:hypothetical protein [Terriglobus roseus]
MRFLLRLLPAVITVVLSTCTHSQEPSVDMSQTLLKGAIVAKNIQTAYVMKLTDDPSFRMEKQEPVQKLNEPNLLIFKDGSFRFDQTPAQQARALMEEMRQGIHILQAVSKPSGMQLIALTGAREYWPKMRDIFCNANPNARYYDLDGLEQFCPNKK